MQSSSRSTLARAATTTSPPHPPPQGSASGAAAQSGHRGGLHPRFRMRRTACRAAPLASVVVASSAGLACRRVERHTPCAGASHQQRRGFTRPVKRSMSPSGSAVDGVAADALSAKQGTFRVVAGLHTYVLALSLPAGPTPAARERRAPPAAQRTCVYAVGLIATFGSGTARTASAWRTSALYGIDTDTSESARRRRA